MNGTDFLTALALLLIFEGLMPFALPDSWKEMIRNIAEMESSKIRTFGLLSMMCGLLLLYWLGS
ncbi:MAG: DUF2065 domain-containing protein [Gammaproteobacteria bacterium]|nr:DUF2065 domain-containing protein [Gammaproteobacteria bacterium]